MRVNEDDLRSWLTWARNYGEIESFESIAPRGRRWLIKLPPGSTFTRDGGEVGWMNAKDGIVPDEFVLTTREALVFCFGLSVAGGRPESRATVAASEWGWGRDDEPSDEAGDASARELPERAEP